MKRKHRTSARRAQRIAELESRLKRMAGPIAFGFSDSCPETVREKFLESVLDFEQREEFPLFDILIREGMDLPPEESLGDEELHGKLWELIERMAMLGVFLHSTNHLSERELYRDLWKDALREPTVLIPENPNFAVHIDLVSSGSEADTHNYLKYFADDETREQWREDVPDFPVPPKCRPPYDRDRHLPRPVHPAFDSHEFQ